MPSRKLRNPCTITLQDLRTVYFAFDFLFPKGPTRCCFCHLPFFSNTNMRLASHHGGTLLAKFSPGDVLQAESDALVTMTGGVTVRGKMAGGFFAAIARAFLTNESFFFQELHSHGMGEALLAPVVPGDVVVIDLKERTEMFLQRGAFLACTPSASITSATQASLTKGVFSGTGPFLLRAKSTGPDAQLAFGAYGAIHCYELSANDQRWVSYTVSEMKRFLMIPVSIAKGCRQWSFSSLVCWYGIRS